jgi:hypothetical protein
MDRWTQFLGSIASGMQLADAMMKHYITRADIEACVRLDPAERQRWEEARIAGRKRKWSAFDLEEIFAEIAAGSPIKAAVQATRPGSKAYKEFVDLCANDSEWKAQYEAALRARSLAESENIIEIADGDGDDTLDNGKGGLVPHSAKVNRDKLRVETRSRLMAAWHTRMFGERKNDVQVNVQVNHAATLEEARSRAKQRRATKVEGTTRELPLVRVSDNDTDWDHIPKESGTEPVLSTIWREET